MGYKNEVYEKSKNRHAKNLIFCYYKNKSCLNYETKEKAEHALNFINEYENQNYVPIRAYLCKCGYWHLTSKKRLFKN